MSDRIELPQGTLDLLILRRWRSSRDTAGRSSSVYISSPRRQGSLYPALHRLARRGWIKARWGTSDNNRRAKSYELTGKGRAQLEADSDAWRRLTAAISRILEA